MRLKRRRLGAATLTAGLVFTLVGGVGSTALANHVQPTFLSGANNTGKSCADNFPGTNEFKVEEGNVTNGTKSGGGFSVTISNLTDDTFNFSSASPTVDGVIVKGGDSGSYKYDYRPNEEDADTGLGVPNPSNNGISHISFCWDPAPGTTTTTSSTSTSTSTSSTSTSTSTSTSSTSTTTSTSSTSTTIPTTSTTIQSTTTTETTPTTLTVQVLGEKIVAQPQVQGAQLPATGWDLASGLMLVGVCLLLGGLILTLGKRERRGESSL